MICIFCAKTTESYVLVVDNKIVPDQTRKKKGWCFECRLKKSRLEVCRRAFPNDKIDSPVIFVDKNESVTKTQPLPSKLLLPGEGVGGVKLRNFNG